MNIFWNIFETLITVFEAFIAMRFVLKFQDYNFSLRTAQLKYVYLSLGYAALTTVITYFVTYEGILGIIYVVFLFVVSLIFTESKIVTKAFVSIVTVLISLAVASATISAFSAAFNRPLNEIFLDMSWVRLVCLILAQMLKVFVYDVILKLAKSKDLMMNKKGWALILTVFGLSFVSIALIQTAAIKANNHLGIFLASELCSIVIAAVCFYMTILLNKTQHESERLRTIAQQEEFRAQYAQNVKKQYEEISKVRHDMKQTNAIVMELLLSSKTDEAIEYMRKMTQRVSEFDVLIDTGNDYVNAILNAKLSEAKRNGITVLCSADKNAVGFDEVDMCNLLGNLLDNAIEACEKSGVDQRMIELNLRRCEGKYLIEVENTAAESALENNKRLSTTKKDTAKHGYGVKSIKSIVEKYNGIVSFSQAGDRFRSTVVLSINK